MVSSDQKEAEVSIGALRPGVTVDAFTAALRSNPDSAIEMAHLDGGASLAAARRAGP